MTLGFLFALALLPLGGCSPPESASMPSPDRSRTLVMSFNRDPSDRTRYLCLKFEVHDSAGKVLTRVQTAASIRARWTLTWEGNNCVRLKSSDAGTLFWQEQADGNWLKLNEHKQPFDVPPDDRPG